VNERRHAPPADPSSGARAGLSRRSVRTVSMSLPSVGAVGIVDVHGPTVDGLAVGESEDGLLFDEPINQFEVIRELGRGGMGRVFLARDTRLGRLVALKLLQAESEVRIRKFLVEAQATARCQHENIVTIHDAGEWQGHPYLVLEYLEGAPLAALMRERPLSPRAALELVMPVVRALIHAHELGIVHRDLKPENIFVTRSGVVKVLDFGIAKWAAAGEREAPGVPTVDSSWTPHSHGASGVGTIPYMAPEQWRGEEVDDRCDVWAIGIILWEMLTAQHPLENTSFASLQQDVPALDKPMPRLAEARADVPVELAAIVDRCLEKRRPQRWSSARELAAAVEALLPHQGRAIGDGENPYPGMRAFQETDADRFFGRRRDVDHLLARLVESPLIALVGPSGVGKSSLVRAGLIPALRSSPDGWEVLATRPGRNPLAALAAMLESSLAGTGVLQDHADLASRLRDEPGLLGTLLRARARQRSGRMLIFIDQFEELYTLVPDAAERRAYTACLTGVADDASTPLRVILSMRSDFLDRAAEDRPFLDRLSAGLHFLSPIDREGLREALVQPLDLAGHGFESPALVEEMLDSVEATSSSLPLLQFTAAKLWDARDRRRRLLTRDSYQAIGGVAGALSAHADEVLAPLSAGSRRLVRALFQELVTVEGTRAITEVAELGRITEQHEDVVRLIEQLTAARLLVVHSREDSGPAVEIVHESLINSWPTLRRWREESAEDTAFVAQLRAAARQWEERGKAAGLLWRGEAVDEVKRFQRRYRGQLAARERAFLDAVLDLDTHAARRTRKLIAGAFALLLGIIVAGVVALVWVRRAEQTAQEQRAAAVQAANRSRVAEERVKQQLETIQRKEAERTAALKEARDAAEVARTGKEKLALTHEQLEQALVHAQQARSVAEAEQKKSVAAAKEIEKLAAAERDAKQRVQQLLEAERARVAELEREQRRLSTKLK
jgi:serine/threonine protein kinase